MKALDITKHKTIMTNILLDIYKESDLAEALGFKGGTAAMLFYGLPRFSVDLDFDLIKPYLENSKELNNVFGKITQLLSKKYKITDQHLKYNTLFWSVSYGSSLSHIKVEISTRDILSNRYNIIPFYGVSLRVMVVEDMIAHKLMAVMERKSLANRDLFDVHYFLSSSYAGDINYDLIKQRAGKEPKDFFKHLLEYVSSIKQINILAGLGEILTESQKDWAKAKLIDELKDLIQRQIDMF
jgi:predicted nucleotidyltransferase component of viral defense system